MNYEQPAFDFSKTARANDKRLLSERFAAFHRDNPRVYVELVRLAKHARRQGRARIGIGMLWEVMRWHFFLETTDDDFKLNNDFRSRYARLMMNDEPELAGCFEVRELKAS